MRHKFLSLVLIGTGAVLLGGAGPVGGPVSMASQEKAGVDELQGRFYAAADEAVVWQVLTDYAHIPRFVSNMKVSRVLQRDQNDVLLVQEMEGGFLFLTKRVHVLLKVHETPNSRITFEDMDHTDFILYQGSWTIEPCSGGGVSVVYQLAAHRNFDLPLAGDSMNGGVKDLLADVQKEIYFRQAMTGPVSGWGSASGVASDAPAPTALK
jgi:ribosome-associated toxin RatA of RatAB toxin-antitoxin module